MTPDPSAYGVLSDVAIGNLDGDGHRDVVVVDATPFAEKARSFLGHGDGTFAAAGTGPTGFGLEAASLGDTFASSSAPARSPIARSFIVICCRLGGHLRDLASIVLLWQLSYRDSLVHSRSDLGGHGAAAIPAHAEAVTWMQDRFAADGPPPATTC